MIVTQRTRRGHPASFTLIELLVVISIIAVLSALTSAAVMKIMNTGPRVRTRTEIGQLETAHASARQDFGGVSFFPSRIKLSPTNNYPNRNVQGSDDANSVEWLGRIFGRRIDLARRPNGALVQDWSGQGQTNAAAAAHDFILEGPECLVFFLGGIPTPNTQAPGTIGFSKDPQFPAPSPFTAVPWAFGPQTYSGYFPFVGSRLLRSPNTNIDQTAKGATTNFLVYIDPYGKVPYAYYSNYDAGNDYNSYGAAKNDCNYLSTQFGPLLAYAAGTAAVPQYVNPKGFQIISAGQDFKFGPGGLNTWTPGSGYNGNGTGADDLSNFSSGVMGFKTN